MRYLFVGALIENAQEDQINDLAFSVAGNKMQTGFCEGIRNNGRECDVISVTPKRIWRGKGILLVRRKEVSHDNGKTVYIPYINFPILKPISIFISLLSSVRKWCKQNKEEYKTIITYNTVSYIYGAVLTARKIYKFQNVGIIADLPLQHRKKSIKQLEDKLEVLLIKTLDFLVPLTRLIANDYFDKEYLVIEGGIKENSQLKKDIKEWNGKERGTVVFSGSLNEVSGIEFALDVFEKMKNKRIELHIYGRGKYEKLVRDYQKRNVNIKYKGYVSEKEIMDIQKKADILICPRKADNFVTKYTFPSKFMEYLLSGTPIIANKLQGVPEEYDQYINFLKPEVNEWIEKIEEIYENMDKYILKTYKGREFVIEKKNWNYQSKKLIDRLEEKENAFKN